MQAKTELDSKICIRDRYRAAVILSTPFELQLQDLKVYSVRDLVTLTSDGVKGSPSVAKVLKSMPKPFQLQLEALLSMVVSIEQQSNLYPGAGESKVGSVLRTTAITKDPTPQPAQMVGPLIDNPRLIQAPLVFDSKFQRGPFDPYGRPARLPGQLPCLVQHSAATRKFRLYGNSGQCHERDWRRSSSCHQLEGAFEEAAGRKRSLIRFGAVWCTPTPRRCTKRFLRVSSRCPGRLRRRSRGSWRGPVSCPTSCWRMIPSKA